MLLKLLLLEVENAFFHLFFLSSGYMDSLKEGRSQARPKPLFFFLYLLLCTWLFYKVVHEHATVHILHHTNCNYVVLKSVNMWVDKCAGKRLRSICDVNFFFFRLTNYSQFISWWVINSRALAPPVCNLPISSRTIANEEYDEINDDSTQSLNYLYIFSFFGYSLNILFIA